MVVVAFALAFLTGYYDYEWAVAEQEFLRTLEINPSEAMAHYWYSWQLALFGRMDEAIVEHILAQKADPLNPLHTAWLGYLYMWEGRYEEAIEEARKSIELAPNFPIGHFVLAEVYAAKGMYEEAVVAAQAVIEAGPFWKWILGRFYALAGRRDEAQKIVTELKAEEPTPWSALGLMVVYASLGDKDEAFRWLAYEHPHAWVPWIKVLPWFESMRDDPDDPRLQAALKRMNLIE